MVFWVMLGGDLHHQISSSALVGYDRAGHCSGHDLCFPDSFAGFPDSKTRWREGR